MAGQIINRGNNTWLVRVYMGREEGKRNYFNKTIHGTKKDAQRFLNGVMHERDLGIFAEPSKETLNKYLDQWLLTAAQPRLRERTFEDYKSLLTNYVRPSIGGKQLSNIKPLDIQELYTNMLIKGLSARTVRYTHAVLRNALGQAVKWQMLQRNPAQYVDLPRQERKEMQVLSPEQVNIFLEESKKGTNYVVFLTAVTTGMRPGEYLGVTVHALWRKNNHRHSRLAMNI